ncbi:hypothetical protein C8Q70DRAFT_1059062 [Cubamyces menziesii]|nr:hypothetical protein C8Q70DRAFT_1059062 [Cubamyces menziesii]
MARETPSAFLEDSEFPQTNYETPQPEDEQDSGTPGPSGEQDEQEDNQRDEERAVSPFLPDLAMSLDDYRMSDAMGPAQEPVEEIRTEGAGPAMPIQPRVNVPPASAPYRITIAPLQMRDEAPDAQARARGRANSSPTPQGGTAVAVAADRDQLLDLSGERIKLTTLDQPDTLARISAARTTVSPPAQPVQATPARLMPEQVLHTLQQQQLHPQQMGQYPLNPQNPPAYNPQWSPQGAQYMQHPMAAQQAVTPPMGWHGQPPPGMQLHQAALPQQMAGTPYNPHDVTLQQPPMLMQPYGAPQQPYGVHPQLYSAQPHPQYNTMQPTGVPLQPFGVPQQPLSIPPLSLNAQPPPPPSYYPMPLQYVQPVMQQASSAAGAQGHLLVPWFVFDPNAKTYGTQDALPAQPAATGTQGQPAAQGPQAMGPPPPPPGSQLKGVSAADRIAQLSQMGIAVTTSQEGFPERHMADPSDYMRSASEGAKAKYARAPEHSRLVVHTAGQLQKRDIKSKESNLVQTFCILIIEAEFEIEQPVANGAEDAYVPGPVTWIVTGLSAEATRLLCEHGVWSTPWVTFSVVPNPNRIPNFVVRLAGFTHNYLDLLVADLQEIFRSKLFIEKLAEAMSKEARYAPEDLEKARKFIDTIKIIPRGEKGGMPVTVDLVMTTPPTTVRYKWVNWKFFVKGCKFHLEWNTAEKAEEVARCRECHGIAHVEYECGYLAIPGWHATITLPEGFETARTQRPNPKGPYLTHPVYAPESGAQGAQEKVTARPASEPQEGWRTRSDVERQGVGDGHGTRAEAYADRGKGEGNREGRDSRYGRAYHPYPPRNDKGEGSSRQPHEDDRNQGPKRPPTSRGSKGKEPMGN